MTPTRQTRRRFLTVAAAAAGAASLAAFSGEGGATPVARWRGRALGAGASMTLAGISQADAAPVIEAIEAEVSRLEAIFSLHRQGSAISRLNATGRLDAPPPEMLELLSLCGAVHASTGGAFDPTVQPLWQLHASAAEQGRRPDSAAITATLARTGWQHIRVSAARIGFARPAMAITLNGTAQGYIADRVAALLRGRGFTNVLVNMGEIYAAGERPGGGDWRAGIAAPDGALIGEAGLRDRALATSAPLGTLIDSTAGLGHIIDAHNGLPGGRWRVVSVSAPRAALADALSTGFCVMERPAIDAALKTHGGARIEQVLA